MASHKKTPEAVAEAKAMKASGKSQVEIAEKFGVSQPCISNWLRSTTSRSRQWTPEDDAEIKAFYEEGFTQAEIGEAFGVSNVLISTRLRKQGITSTKKKLTPELVAQVEAMAAQGMTQVEIAAVLDVSQGLISTALKGSEFTKDNATRVTSLSLYPERYHDRVRAWISARRERQALERKLDRQIVEHFGGVPKNETRRTNHPNQTVTMRGKQR